METDQKSRVERLAERYSAWCRRWEQVLLRHPGANDQIQRACSSLVANIGEGMDAETLAEKRRYFGYALASAGESLRLVGSAAQSGVLSEAAVEEGRRLLRDVKWDLIRLIRWTKR